MLTFEPDFARRIHAVGESKTTRVFSQANELRRQGKEIISLAVGEPDFETPAPVIAATQRALSEQQTRYGAVGGLEELRSRLAAEFPFYGPQNIIVTNGAKQALFSIFQLICDPGDEIILPRPCWVSFTEQIKLAGGRPVVVDTVKHQIDPEAILAAVTPRTRAILINSPNNPTGAVYSEDALAAVARIAEAHRVYVISDEAYHAFVYDGMRHVPMYKVMPDPRQVITVRSFSKQYNMTGFRLGYVAAHEAVVQSLTKLQSHLCGNVCTFAQHGALAALEMDQALVEQRRAALQRRRDLAYDRARRIFDCIRPQGAFYLFADVSRHLHDDETSAALALRLLDQAGVAVVPGEAFGGPGHIRISFGTDETGLQAAFQKIKEVL
jgi:aspartate aminotransferase